MIHRGADARLDKTRQTKIRKISRGMDTTIVLKKISDLAAGVPAQ